MRILGIDIGSTSVKAVEFESTFGRFEIQEYHEQKIVLGDDIATSQREAVQTLLRSLPKAPDKIAVALTNHASTFRNLQLPTKDRKTIQSSIAFEIEDEVPFSEEERLEDFAILGQGPQGSLIHVATTLRSKVQDTLTFWNSAGVDPDLVTTDTWAYRAIVNAVAGSLTTEAPVLILDMGHRSTHLFVQHKNYPVTSRELSVGGKDLTLAVCKKYQLPYEQAESAKLDHGFIIAPSRRDQATHEQIEFSDALSSPLSELLREVKRALLYAKGNTSAPVSHIFLMGQTALIPGLSALIEEEFNIPVKNLPALSGLGNAGVSYSESSDLNYGFAAGLGLLLAAPEKNGVINFRKGEYAKQGASQTIDFKTLRRPLVSLSIILASIFISSLLQYGVYQTQQKEVNRQLTSSLKSFFSGISDSASRGYIADPKKLKAAVEKELKKTRDLAVLSDPNPESPLLFLKDLSSSITKDSVTDLIKFEVGASPTAPYSPNDPKTVSLTFISTSTQTLDKIANILEKKMTDLQKSKIEDVTVSVGTGTEKKWKVTFSGKPTERAYGR